MIIHIHTLKLQHEVKTYNELQKPTRHTMFDFDHTTQLYCYFIIVSAINNSINLFQPGKKKNYYTAVY